MKKARKIDPIKRQIKFDEVEYPVSFERYEQLLKESNFSGTVLEILTMYINGLKVIMPSLITIPITLTREEYEIKVRCYLGCGTVFIFGKILVTATIKQLSA